MASLSNTKPGRRVWDFLGSRDLSVFIFICALTYLLFLAIFAVVVPLPWVTSISKLLPFKVLYLLFFVNLVICEVKWIPGIIRRCRKPMLPGNMEDLQRFRHKIQIQDSRFKMQNLVRSLRRRGYKIQGPGVNGQGLELSDSPILHAYRGRFSPVGNLLFHMAFIFLFFGAMLSLLFRFSGNARITEGYEFAGNINEYSMLSASPLTIPPKAAFFLEKITPKFWGDGLLFTDLKADVSYNDNRGSLWMSSPISIGGGDVTIQGIGLTPRYVLKDKEGRVLDIGDVNLAVFIPGSEDHFKIPGFPHQIFLSFYPDYEIRGGNVINRSMNVNNPAYAVKIFRGRIQVFSGLVKPGEEAKFENLSLSFPEFRYWGDFRIVKDPGFIYVWMAFILFGTGLIWRLLFYGREMVLVKEGDSIYLYGKSDYYNGLFESTLIRFARNDKE